ncbi:4Fe-4S binding protein [Heliorestis acidaminivorans]|uniref:4Fe-4S binding protein n=1 Tax=Heliorestis acidaminivorans TaxID=553427 RepID=A0A6I0EYS6_9FIRM|nr:4Fe-4S binding protein [Heliorestis acidaminivorans]KAB2953656.1 4Fe-4S binding protein [Heliorestis acidaminivorans]
MHSKYKDYAFIITLSYLTLGLFYPLFGYVMALCMLTAIGISLFAGRKWCGTLCPRGFLYDKFLGQNKKKSIPAWLKTKQARYGFFAIFMGVFMWRLYLTGGDVYAIGSVFITMGIISGLIGFGLGMLYKTRSWCAICPMGTMASWFASLRAKPAALTLAADCKTCRVCEKSCPMDVPIVSYKSTEPAPVADHNCIKCKVCVSTCPRGAIA